MIEYPKWLYRNGLAEYRIVDDAKSEKEARHDGFAVFGEVIETVEVEPKKRGRPAKAD